MADGKEEMGKFDKFMELKEDGGQFGDEEMFKCEECGAQTYPDKGWDGEPDLNNCKKGCSTKNDWFPGRVSLAYKRNFDRIFKDKEDQPQRH